MSNSNENLKVLMPKSIGDKISFNVENSPIRHGKIIEFITRSEGNTFAIVGYRVKCKNSSKRVVYINEVIEEE